MYNIAIVEDNESDALALKAALTKYEGEANVKFSVVVFTRAEDFLNYYKSAYDIVFMDMELPFMNGVEAAEKMRQFDENVILIFTTNIASLAIKGYGVGALDYFLKPVEYCALKLRLDRAIRILNENAESINVHVVNGHKKLLVKDIVYIESFGHELTYYTQTEEFTVRGNISLKGLEQQLAQKFFVRCNSGCLVNLKYCSGINGDELHLGKYSLRISRGMKKGLVEKLAAYYKYLGGGGR